MPYRARLTLLVLVHATAFYFCTPGIAYVGFNDLVLLLLLPVILSQPGLVAIWIVFGTWSGLWRFALFVGLFAGGILAADAWVDDTRGFFVTAQDLTFGILLAFFVCTLMITACLLGLRMLGVTVGKGVKPVRTRRMLQFTLGGMLQSVAATAVILGPLSTVSRRIVPGELVVNLESLVVALIASLIGTAIVCISLWLALAEGFGVARFLAVTFCVPTALLSIIVALAVSSEVAVFACLTFGVVVSTTCSLLVFRGSGVRVRWRRRRAEVAVPEENAAC